MLRHPLRALGSRHHEHRVGTFQGTSDRCTVAVLRLDGCRTIELGSAGKITHDQPLRHSGSGEPTSYPATQPAGGTGHNKHARKLANLLPSRRLG
ncbi:hypothetical protein GCM10012275_31700 [Longimycelium tulufanense]|uniref:Uncharacterized protein n=1 Tax=Longimycelium tulufanense TaxID=907463 RepID=A0A8J3C937_9PSEU|nr:hypothetical protein GCM10012275_31700 [Longimycelium tulufanense]